METNSTNPQDGHVNTEDIPFEEINRSGEFDPLNNEAAHKVANPSMAGIEGDLTQPIPPANHDTSYVEDITDKNSKDGKGVPPPPGAQHAAPPPPDEPFNPDFAEMPPNQQDDSARLTATAFVHAYAGAKMLFPTLIAISERKLKKLEKAGEIDLGMQFRESRQSPRMITILEFVNNFNDTLTKPFETSEEFKENVIPLLTEILKKKGVALTPEQLLMYYVGEDLIATIKNAINASIDRREMLDHLKELTAASRSAAPVTPVTPDVPGQPPVAAAQQAPPPAADATTIVSNIVDDALSTGTKKKRKPGRPVGTKKK